ncbi:hypothetical protein ABD70_09660 [Alkalihalobacillus lehensis]|nr:hypothetical protein [Shouchella lehensis]
MWQSRWEINATNSLSIAQMHQTTATNEGRTCFFSMDRRSFVKREIAKVHKEILAFYFHYTLR